MNPVVKQLLSKCLLSQKTPGLYIQLIDAGYQNIARF